MLLPLLAFADDPVLYLDFEGTNNPSGVTVVGAPLTFTSGKEGNGLHLQGTSALSTQIFIDQLGAGTSWTAWVKPLHIQERRQLLSIDDGAFDWTIGVENGEWNIYSGGRRHPTGFSADFGQWQWVQAIFDPEKGYVIFGKNAEYKVFHHVTVPQTQMAIGIGFNPGFGEYFEGVIDEVRIYDRALTISETQLLNEEAGAFNQSPTTDKPFRVLWVRVSFPDTELVYEGTNEELDSMMRSIDSKHRRASFDKSSFEWDIATDTYQMPMSAQYYGGTPEEGLRAFELTQDAIDAVSSEYATDSYDLVGVIMGLITVNTFPGTAWRSGGGDAGGTCNHERCIPFNIIRSVNEGTIYHELGHNLGMGHSCLWIPNDGELPDGEGHGLEYGYPFDVMGFLGYPLRFWGELNHYYKYQLGYLGVQNVHHLKGSEVLTLRPFDSGEKDGYMSAVIPRHSGVRYFLGFRSEYGINPYSQYGLEILRVDESDSSRPSIIDTTPHSPAGSIDAPLVVGKTFSFSETPYHVTPLRLYEDESGPAMDIYIHRDDGSTVYTPTVAIEIPMEIRARELNWFKVSADDPDNEPLAIHWDIGDGLYETESSTSAVRRGFLTGGNREIKVTISDMRGGIQTIVQNINVVDPLINGWSIAIPPLGGRRWMDVEYLNGSFFAVGDKLAISSDGLNWTIQNLGIQLSHLESICWGNDRFVAVGVHWHNNAFYGVTAYSNDGVLWQYRIHFDLPPLKAVTDGPSGFVAVGEFGALLFSSDGITWEINDSLETEEKHLLAAVHDPDFGYVIAGTGNHLFSSNNAKDWVRHDSISNWSSLVVRDLKVSENGIHISASSAYGFWSRSGEFIWKDLWQIGWVEDIAIGGDYIFGVRIQYEPGLWVSRDGLRWESINCEFSGHPTGMAFKANTVVVCNIDGSILVNEHRTQIDYSGWISQFPQPNKHSGHGKFDDPDGDSLVNIVEYHIGSNPMVADLLFNDSCADLGLISGEDSLFTINYERRSNSAEPLPILELSSDLVNWSAIESVEEISSPKSLYTEEVQAIFEAPKDRFFIRLSYE